MAKHKKKISGLPRAIISFIVLVAAVFAAYVAILCEGDLSWDNIERTMINLRARVKQVEKFEYPSADGALMADLSGGMLRLTGTEVAAYSAGGGELYSEKLRLENPAIHSANGRAVAYGSGDTEVRVFDGAGLIYELETDEPVMSASISSGGKLAVCTREEGWSGSVTVYGISGKAVYKWYCASGYPSVAAVSKDGNLLSVLTLGSGGSQIVFIRLDREEEQARLQLADELAVDIKFMSGGALAVLSENRLIMATARGDIAGEYDFEGLGLSAYSLGSDDMTLLALSDPLGRNIRLVTVNESGEAVGSLEVESPVLSMSASGTRSAVLYGDSAVIYRRDMVSTVTLLLSEQAETVLMRDDGSALIAGSYSAEVLEP